MADNLYATLETNHGDVVIQLFPDQAPKTVENFVGLAQGTIEWSDPTTGDKSNAPFYEGLTFHRVIPGFMIQGGCPRGDGRGGPGYTFKDEFHPDLTFNRPYLLAMANSGPGTNGSQFFITVGPTPHLNNRHTIFGEVRRPGEPRRGRLHRPHPHRARGPSGRPGRHRRRRGREALNRLLGVLT